MRRLDHTPLHELYGTDVLGQRVGMGVAHGMGRIAPEAAPCRACMSFEHEQVTRRGMIVGMGQHPRRPGLDKPGLQPGFPAILPGHMDLRQGAPVTVAHLPRIGQPDRPAFRPFR